jgi:acyl-homoserine-lactone acylase
MLRSTFFSLLLAGTVWAQSYEARIRRTSFGIPHIEAKTLADLGFGEGYAFAEDHLCSLADQVVRARGERAQYFGAGPNERHLRNDVAMRALDIYETATKDIQAQPKEIQDWFKAYVAGYNQYLAEKGKDKIGGWCRGAEWVRPITLEDLAAYHRVYLLTLTAYGDYIATATPPGHPGVTTAGLQFPPVQDLASNGWALGKDKSATGGGMLIANPHYPWYGSNRFWEKHLTVPGQLDIYGVSLLGTPGVSIGFNKDVAWTHTVSAGKRQTVYALKLVPGKPTVYRYGNEEREMKSRVIVVNVKQADGSMKKVERTVWYSHYGPVVNIPLLGWTANQAYAVRDANWDNSTLRLQWMAMAQAKSMAELQAAHAKYQGIPWVNTIATSREGKAWYADTSSTPMLSAEALAALAGRIQSDAIVRRFYEQGQILLDGSNPRDEWVNDEGARVPGVVAYRHMPQVERTDYVFNANDSFWFPNSRALIQGPYSLLHGDQNTARSLRTRNNDLTLSNQSPDRPAGDDGKFTLDEMANALLSNRSLAAELLKDELVARCRGQELQTVGESQVDLKEACAVLAAWDGRFNLESQGAVLFREFMGRYEPSALTRKGPLFAVDFDPKDPVNTPRGLAPGPLALQNLARAVQLMQERKLPLNLPLGEVQYVDKAGRRFAIHGGHGSYEGVKNMQQNAGNATTLEPQDRPEMVKGSRFLTEKGYPVGHGSSFLMALEYTPKGPRAKAFLTYSQSGDPASPHFTDQTERFSQKQWRPVLFGPKEIAKDVKRDYKVKSK